MCEGGARVAQRWRSEVARFIVITIQYEIKYSQIEAAVRNVILGTTKVCNVLEQVFLGYKLPLFRSSNAHKSQTKDEIPTTAESH